MKPRLYITAPSYAMRNPAEKAKTLKTAQAWADALGWQVVPSPLLDRYQQYGVWLPVEARAEDLATALQHEIIWAFRGGYAAVHLVPALLQAAAGGRPWLIGYSDTTVLHACWQVRGWGPAFYGTLSETTADARQAASLLAFLRGQAFECTSEAEPAARVLRPGAVRAPLFAACLVVLASLCGTPAFPDLRGRILAIEDIDERPYAIDFALNQMYLAGKLDGVVGLLGGAFHHQVAADYGGPTVDEILADWADRLGVPTIGRLPFGHMEDPLVLRAGAVVELEAWADGRWRLGWPADQEMAVAL
ncbi:MAG: LD-carboxypeptidase [Anaerolineae bacterium]